MTTGDHNKDSDCTVVDGSCTGCGTYHGDPCDVCGGAGFHKDGCPESEATPEVGQVFRRHSELREVTFVQGCVGVCVYDGKVWNTGMEFSAWAEWVKDAEEIPWHLLVAPPRPVRSVTEQMRDKAMDRVHALALEEDRTRRGRMSVASAPKESIRGEYGAVKITRGRHKGRTGYYDNDEGDNAVVYLGQFGNGYVMVRHSSMEPLTDVAEDLVMARLWKKGGDK